MFKIFHKHYGTERFFVMMFALLLVIISLFVYGKTIADAANRKTLSSTALYTRQFTWSRTSAKGQVVSLIADSAKTKVFMLIKNNAYTSFDANDYEVFFTRQNRDEERLNDPALTIYSYGASGYVGFYFTDAKGFANQIVDIIVRNDSAASEAANDNMRDPNAYADQSFYEHNQIKIYANFGASGIKTSSVFDSGNVNQLTLFANTAGVLPDNTDITGTYNTIRLNANSKLTQMASLRLQFEQYAQNLGQMGVVVPDLPYWIAGDRIDTVPYDPDSAIMEFDPSMIQTSDWSSSSSGGSLLLGEEEEEPNNSSSNNSSSESSGNSEDKAARDPVYYIDGNGNRKAYSFYHFDTLPPGCVNLEYQGKLLSDGFISQTSFYKDLGRDDALMAYDMYVAWRNSMKSTYKSAMPAKIKYETWRKRDGSYVVLDNSDLSNVSTVINNYMTALNKYLECKQQYFGYMDELLELEHKIYLLGQNTTVSPGLGGGGKQNIWLY